LAILSILISRFPNHISSSNYDPPPLLVLAPLLSHQRPVVRKRTIVTLSQFIPISPPELFTGLLKSNVLPDLVPAAGQDKQRTTVQLIAAVARHSPSQIAPFLEKIIPQILQAVDKDDDELREGSLQALEALVLRCPAETDSYLPAIVEAGSKYIKYDPVSSGKHISFTFLDLTFM
jgi:cullin-associated NEDD8-dissociated protein 1